MKWIKTLQSASTVVALVTIVSLSSILASANAQQENIQQSRSVASINSVQLSGDASASELLVTTSVPVTYTNYKTTNPSRLVVDFSLALPSAALQLPTAQKGLIKSVSIKHYDTDAGPLSRMEILLDQDVEPIITPLPDNPSVLKFTFPVTVVQPVVQSQPLTPGQTEQLSKVQEPVKTEQIEKPVSSTEPNTKPHDVVNTATPEPKEATSVPSSQLSDTPSKTTLNSIDAKPEYIELKLSGPPSEFKSFRLNKPERVVIDILDATSTIDSKIIQLNSQGVATARIGTYSDKVRVVFDAVNGSLPDSVIERTSSGLKVKFPAGPAESLPASPLNIGKPVAAKATAQQTKPVSKAIHPTIESIDFQCLETVSRVLLKFTGDVKPDEPVKSPGFITIKFKNTLLPKHLQRSFETRNFNSNVLRITPIQLKTKSGHDAVFRVTLKSDEPFKFNVESDLASLEVPNPTNKQPVTNAPVKTQQAAKASPVDTSVEKQILQNPDSQLPVKKQFAGRKVTLEFADAEVRKIFQLLSEVSGKNFVLGDEVSGTISLKLVNVPWDQALDIILDTKGLDKREDGNIVLIRGKGKFKSAIDEESDIKKSLLKNEELISTTMDVNYSDIDTLVSQFKEISKTFSERGMITKDQRTNKIIIRDLRASIDQMKNLLKVLDVPEKQVMIEARIIEATQTFTRSLGVNWGVHYRDASASILGINALDTVFGGAATATTPPSGVNTSKGVSSDISFGTLGSNIKLDLRLSAAESAMLARIISTPKVATLNHKTAKILQGEQIPYTSISSDKADTKFVEAALSLEVTPHINPNGTIVMKIDAKNDSKGATPAGGGAPPINKKEAVTEMMLRDGETTVIGGIYTDNDTSGQDGVPFMKDIPLLGGLFRSSSKDSDRRELLIFITPRILTFGNS